MFLFFLQKANQDCLEDERIALFLQNEEFLSELRINQDFLSTLDQDIGEKGSGHDTEAFKERLRNMGKSKAELIFFFFF